MGHHPHHHHPHTAKAGHAVPVQNVPVLVESAAHYPKRTAGVLTVYVVRVAAVSGVSLDVPSSAPVSVTVPVCAACRHCAALG